MNPAVTTGDRFEELRQRCEQQRQQLNQQFVAIETQLHATDLIVSTLRGALKRPELWFTALTSLWAVKKSIQGSGLWSLIGRGWMVWSAAKRVMKWFNNR